MGHSFGVKIVKFIQSARRVFCNYGLQLSTLHKSHCAMKWKLTDLAESRSLWRSKKLANNNCEMYDNLSNATKNSVAHKKKFQMVPPLWAGVGIEIGGKSTRLANKI